MPNLRGGRGRSSLVAGSEAWEATVAPLFAAALASGEFRGAFAQVAFAILEPKGSDAGNVAAFERAQTIFRGVRLLVATRLRKQVQEEVVRRGGGAVVGGVHEAIARCTRVDPPPLTEDLVFLATLPKDKWPRLVTQEGEWAGQCSKILSADGARTDVLRKHHHTDSRGGA
ncbi:hypothetical protein EMIHUDRAFT_223315 [Emiliania huxleyi CCMP1516]|uniref:Uncharacterized protein n=2 Tax=Emiliania huxleyi TaxID=2903 RepID=A0A0D3KVK2_EMIH1|nr:hypothetical protein EMIHUDRAFT_223315 [Emiliania huxleyi CCMP1516]EOD39787.1 hypothetical protein EMIHUDRAFT_223315 [Emiliania huxleyi CCMP1516]|eukprot:XP_005792216.1 hypothetical protein EMIHUDRAFT_223315 [Emiliania huxleyi CCMP1516]